MKKEDYQYFRFQLSLSKQDNAQKQLGEMLSNYKPFERNRMITSALIQAFRIAESNPFAERDYLLDRADITEERITQLAAEEKKRQERQRMGVSKPKKDRPVQVKEDQTQLPPETETSVSDPEPEEVIDESAADTDDTEEIQVSSSAMDFLKNSGFM